MRPTKPMVNEPDGNLRSRLGDGGLTDSLHFGKADRSYPDSRFSDSGPKFSPLSVSGTGERWISVEHEDNYHLMLDGL
jgi:hypothetical protein